MFLNYLATAFLHLVTIFSLIVTKRCFGIILILILVISYKDQENLFKITVQLRTDYVTLLDWVIVGLQVIKINFWTRHLRFILLHCCN